MSKLLDQLSYTICNAPVRLWPFPHIYVENVFPQQDYDQILANLPSDTNYDSGKSSYHGRRFADPTKLDPLCELDTPEFAHIGISPFRHFILKRFGQSKPQFHTDLRLVRDCENYSIGPHTDAPWKVLSYLFYLPPDTSLRPYGTSIFTPKDSSFVCPGGPHHSFDQFHKIFTAPFLPNSLFAFFKTEYSFHGVETITIPCQRDVLLWNLYDSTARNGKASK